MYNCQDGKEGESEGQTNDEVSWYPHLLGNRLRVGRKQT